MSLPPVKINQNKDLCGKTNSVRTPGTSTVIIAVCEQTMEKSKRVLPRFVFPLFWHFCSRFRLSSFQSNYNIIQSPSLSPFFFFFFFPDSTLTPFTVSHTVQDAIILHSTDTSRIRFNSFFVFLSIRTNLLQIWHGYNTKYCVICGNNIGFVSY